MSVHFQEDDWLVQDCYNFKTQEELDKFADEWWGHDERKLTKENLMCLIDGEAIGTYDGEYSHSIVIDDETRAWLKDKLK